MQNINPLRLGIKAILIFVIANLAFAFFNPPIGDLTIYNWLVSGRMRFPYERSRDNFLLDHNLPVFENFDAMFASTVIAAPKLTDEYRVIFLGDSSMWGFNLAPQYTLPEQINELNLQTCDGRHLRAYNLGFPLPSFMRDILLIQKVKEYAPDLIVWGVTLDTFLDKRVNDQFYEGHSDDVLALNKKYDLKIDTNGLRPTTFWNRTIVGQRLVLDKVAILQLNGIVWSATGIDFYVRTSIQLKPDGPQVAVANADSPKAGKKLLQGLAFNMLDVGRSEAADIPMIIVNEPIQNLSLNADDPRYNPTYSRRAYDTYRDALLIWLQNGKYNFIDSWDALPSRLFASALHLSKTGEQLLAQKIAPKLVNFSCK